MKSYTVFVECRSPQCGNEDILKVNLPDGYSDSDARKAVEAIHSACSFCGHQDWVISGKPVLD